MPTRSRDDSLVTYGEAATILDVSERTVRRIVADGLLAPKLTRRTVRGAHYVRFSRRDVEALVEQATA